MSRFPVPAARHREEQVVSRSRFLCTLAHAASPAEAQELVRSVGAEFPEATHHCWAFVAGAPGDTSHVGCSDDGEPHGTAGRPMLTVLLHAGVGEIVAVVSRWYGGTKLGTGGLVRAYGGAVQQALATLPTIMRVDAIALQVVADYGAVNQMQQLLPSLEAVVHAERYTDVVTWELEVERSREDALRAAVADITRGSGIVREAEPPVVDR